MRKAVIVADDVDVKRQELADIPNALDDIDVFECSNANAAYRQFRTPHKNQEYDEIIVITDLHMDIHVPHNRLDGAKIRSGTELAEKIKDIDDQTRILLVSAGLSPRMKAAFEEEGIVDCAIFKRRPTDNNQELYQHYRDAVTAFIHGNHEAFNHLEPLIRTAKMQDYDAAVERGDRWF